MPELEISDQDMSPPVPLANTTLCLTYSNQIQTEDGRVSRDQTRDLFAVADLLVCEIYFIYHTQAL